MSRLGLYEFALFFGIPARRLPFQGRPKLGSPMGWCSAQRIRILMIASGNHTLI